ncbi:MAG: hypothetical protein HFG41_13555 [Coprococcus sp.]|nr:hypothetical protein [Coprococcus sp.]
MSRLGIFQMSDKDGIVERYITYLLADLRKNLDQLVIVVNGTLQEDEAKKLEPYAEYIFYRKNVGFDAYAFQQTILEFIGVDEIRRYDELLLCNDTFYGPFYPFKSVFDEMAESSADFWGLTMHAATTSVGSGCKRMQEHIQSYFVVYRKSVLLSNDFELFWRNVNFKQYTFLELVYDYEIRMTQYFASKGFTYEAYVKDGALNGSEEYNYNHYAFSPYLLIKKYKMPVIKRKVFMEGKNLGMSAGEEVEKAFLYIERRTSYDIDMIWSDLLRKVNITDIKNTLNLNYVLPVESNYELPPGKRIAVIAHITYDDLIEDCMEYLLNIPEEIDLYVTSYKDNVLQRVKDIAESKKANLYTKQIINRGRDVSAIFVGGRNIVPDYDYICFVHDKKTSGNRGQYITGASFHDLVWENTVGSKGYIKNVIQLFENNPRLGLLSPPEPLHNNYSAIPGREWLTNYKRTFREMERMGLNVPVGEHRQPYALSTTFWFRREALRKVFEYPLRYEDFIEEPVPMDGELNHALERVVIYAAQDAGYYSGIVMNSRYASLNIQNLYLLVARLNVKKMSRLWKYIASKDSFYIYGAGGEAQILKRQMDDMEITPKGFVVSDSHFATCKSELEPIIKLSDFPKGEGLVIALNRENTKEVEKELKKIGITDVWYFNNWDTEESDG